MGLLSRHVADLLRLLGRSSPKEPAPPAGAAGTVPVPLPAGPVGSAPPVAGMPSRPLPAGRRPAAAWPRQGSIGDCWLMAPLVACWSMSAEMGERAVRPAAAPGHVEVRLFEHGSPVWITVSPDVPVDERGLVMGAHVGRRLPGRPSLVEKAVAQRAGSYAALRQGFAGEGFRRLVGTGARLIPGLAALDDLSRWLGEGRPAVVSTHPLARLARVGQVRLEPMHVYVITAADPAAGTVTLRNPWGHNVPTARQGARPRGPRGTADAEVVVPARVLRRAAASTSVLRRSLRGGGGWCA